MTNANPHLDQEVSEWGPQGAPLAVLGLHGRGQSPALIGELRATIGDEILRWVAPAAAQHEWYPFRFMDEPPAGDPWLRRSFELIDARLEALAATGIPADRVVLLGFSQGACLAAHYALLHPRRYAGLALLTGGYIGPGHTAPEFSGDLDGTPALLATREGDAWVPLGRVRETADALRRLGARVTSLAEPPGEHAVSATAALLLGRLLSDVAATPTVHRANRSVPAA